MGHLLALPRSGFLVATLICAGCATTLPTRSATETRIIATHVADDHRKPKEAPSCTVPIDPEVMLEIRKCSKIKNRRARAICIAVVLIMNGLPNDPLCRPDCEDEHDETPGCHRPLK